MCSKKSKQIWVTRRKSRNELRGVIVSMERKAIIDEALEKCGTSLKTCRYHEGAWRQDEGAYILSARKFNSEMERRPEWFDRKSTSSGFMIYW